MCQNMLSVLWGIHVLHENTISGISSKIMRQVITQCSRAFSI
jgi:hypothetical protein